MFKVLSAKAAVALDLELMSTGAFSIDQLMELAGLAVAKAIYKQYPPAAQKSKKVLVLVGPGNNGGDGLVCARHLSLWKLYEPVIYYPKKPQKDLYVRLSQQLKDLGVGEVGDILQVKSLLEGGSVAAVVDSLFGFSFKPPVREPYTELLNYLLENSQRLPPIIAVDIPSGWDVEKGPVDVDIGASMLVSLTAPKPCARFFNKEGKVHYLGGRFINDAIAKKYDIEELIARYENDELVVKL